jgi:MFS family permease
VAGILFAAAIVLGIFFFRHEGRVKNPVIDLQMLKEKPFFAANMFNLLYGMAVLGVMSFIPLYATSVFGMSTLESGLILTPRSIGMMAASVVTSIFLPKWGYRWPMITGTGILVFSLALLGMELTDINIGVHLSGAVVLGIIMFISGVGMGIVAPAANNACIELMPHRIATITGVRGMFRQSGSAMAISISALVLENFSSMGQGFTLVFYGLAVILVLAVPFIFAMPKACVVIPAKTDARTT